MKIALSMLAMFLGAAAAQAQGTIAGCVTDRAGGVLPGVKVVATGPAGNRTIVTQASGCYEFKGLEAGAYVVSAALVGFSTGKRESIAVADGQTTGPVDFALCVGPLSEVLWVTFGGLDEAWKKADVVVHLRISGSGPVREECPSDDFMQTAQVIEVLRNTSGKAVRGTLAFRKEYWASERTPYPIGQEMVVFLTSTREGFRRLVGPFYVWLFDGNRVVNAFGPRVDEGTTPSSFLARLRELAKQVPGPGE